MFGLDGKQKQLLSRFDVKLIVYHFVLIKGKKCKLIRPGNRKANGQCLFCHGVVWEANVYLLEHFYTSLHSSLLKTNTLNVSTIKINAKKTNIDYADANVFRINMYTMRHLHGKKSRKLLY